MCRSTKLKNKMHKPTVAFNRAFTYFCLQIIIYFSPDNSLAYCEECRLAVGGPGLWTPTYFHLITLGNDHHILCERCGGELIVIRSVINCSYCLFRYSALMDELRGNGHSPDRIIRLIYDCINRSFISLETQEI